MAKVVFNDCFGGFGLSHEAIMRYAEIKGIDIRAEPADPRFARLIAFHYYLGDQPFNCRAISREDPALVQVVEEMGRKAGSDHALLDVREIPDGTRYVIDEHDGAETVKTIEDIDWIVAGAAR